MLNEELSILCQIVFICLYKVVRLLDMRSIVHISYMSIQILKGDIYHIGPIFDVPYIHFIRA